MRPGAGRAPSWWITMSVTLLCPNLKCRSVLQVPDTARGQKVRCGQCGMAFVVPAKTAPTTAGAPNKPPVKEPAGK